MNYLWDLITTAVDCGAPQPPLNGTVDTYSSTTEGSSITYHCNMGLFPVNKLVSVCSCTGQWTPNPTELSCTTELSMHQVLQFCTCDHSGSQYSLLLSTHSTTEWLATKCYLFTGNIWLQWRLHPTEHIDCSMHSSKHMETRSSATRVSTENHTPE